MSRPRELGICTGAQGLRLESIAKYRELIALVEADGDALLDGTCVVAAGSGWARFGALARDYLDSAVFKEKAASTQEIYRRVLDQLSAEPGHPQQYLGGPYGAGSFQTFQWLGEKLDTISFRGISRR